MGLVEFAVKYYSDKLDEYENNHLKKENIYEAKQLLKLLDDLEDESETHLNELMESEFSCLTRLRTLLDKYGEEPFPIDHERLQSTTYGDEEYELTELLEILGKKAGAVTEPSKNPFLNDVIQYCEWIGYSEDTAYVFLLRDSLLPYMYYYTRGRKDIYPWLLSRRSLEEITATPSVDDEIRLSLCEALENGHIEFDEFSSFCRSGIVSALDNHQELRACLTGLLGSIDKEHIMIVESGYIGTLPMMLKALDERIDIRLYTTAPFLYETYSDRIFHRRYEDMRKFETIYSHDLLMRFSSFHNGKFYVNKSVDDNVNKMSLAEIKKFLV